MIIHDFPELFIKIHQLERHGWGLNWDTWQMLAGEQSDAKCFSEQTLRQVARESGFSGASLNFCPCSCFPIESHIQRCLVWWGRWTRSKVEMQYDSLPSPSLFLPSCLGKNAEPPAKWRLGKGGKEAATMEVNNRKIALSHYCHKQNSFAISGTCCLIGGKERCLFP